MNKLKKLPLGEEKKRFKMYKVKKQWIVAPIVFVGLLGTSALATNEAHAAELEQQATTEQLQENSVSSPPSKVEEDTQSKSALETKTPVNLTTTGDEKATENEAKANEEEYKQQLAEQEAEKNKVTEFPAAQSDAEYQNQVATYEKEVAEKQVQERANQEAHAQATKEREEAVEKGSADLKESTENLDKQVEEARKDGHIVTENLVEIKPLYKPVEGLEGQGLLDATLHNVNLYREAIDKAVKNQDSDTEKIKALREDYAKQLAQYKKLLADHQDTITRGKNDLSVSAKNQDNVIEAGKRAGLDVKEKRSQLTPDYVPLKGLKGKALDDAFAKNLQLYKDAIAKGIGVQDKATAEMGEALEKYLTEKAKYDNGIVTKTGLKWTKDTTITAGANTYKMLGTEPAVNWGNIRDAARTAIQGLSGTQNTDATFDNIFRIDPRAEINIGNTSNGDIGLEFYDVVSPNNTGTYVVVYGDEDGGIAFGVFALYNGAVTGGAGEGAEGGGYGSGAILNYVRSFKVDVSSSQPLSVMTYNDIDNHQTVVITGLDGADITVGKNVSQSGNSFSAGAGDVSQGSAGVLSSNGVRFVFDSPRPFVYTVEHSTSENNTSIVGGIFGADSDIVKEPEKVTLEAEKVDVAIPEEPEAPEKIQTEVTKYTVAILPTETAPTPVLLPSKPIKPAEPVNVTYNIDPKPVVVAQQSIATLPTLPKTGEKETALLSLLGGLLVLGTAGTFKKKNS